MSLHPDLQQYLRKSEIGQLLQHPLVYSVPYFGEAEDEFLNLLYAQKSAQVEQARAAKDWHHYVWLHEKPYRLYALQTAEFGGNMDDRLWWELVGEIWANSENIWQNLATWKRLWRSKRPGRMAVMDEEDHKLLRELPPEATIYRGVQKRNTKSGISWTTDLEKAHFFANRWKPEGPRVLKTVIQKDVIWAAFAGRGEKEVVCLPKLDNITIEG